MPSTPRISRLSSSQALFSLLAILLVCLCVPLHAARDWLEEAMAKPTPDYVKDAPALVLLHEELYDWNDRGELSLTIRHAVRILTEGGRRNAVWGMTYNGKSDRVDSKTAWRLRPGTRTERRGSVEWVDGSAQDGGELFNEYRYVSCNLYDQTIPGDVFAVEVRISGPQLFAMVPYRFGGTLPLLRERVSVSLPPGFSVQERVFGKDILQRTEKGPRTWTWEVLNTPFIPDESLAPAGSKNSVRLWAEIVPPAGDSKFPLKRFANWREANDWDAKLNADSCDTSPELRAKALELSKDCSDDLARIRALTLHVQNTRYVAVNENLLNGAGYVARKASKILGLDYGDCKDKANLLRALLREVGIESHPVGIHVAGRLLVEESVPTLEQFNHAILAVRVPDSTDLPACVDVAGVGRLLFIDPTNAFTHVGDIPYYDQGQLVQVVHPAVNSLVRLPLISPEKCFAVKRVAQLEVGTDNSLTMNATFTALGQTASELRGSLRYADNEKKREELLRKILGTQLRTANIDEYRFVDDRNAGTETLTLRTRQPAYLQRPQKNMLVARLNLLNSAALPLMPEKERRLPFLVNGACEMDEVTLQLPAGTEVEQLPRSVNYSHRFGALSIAFENGGDKVLMRRTLTVNHGLLQPEDFAEYRKFLSEVARADKASLLLRPAALPAATPAAPQPAGT